MVGIAAPVGLVVSAVFACAGTSGMHYVPSAHHAHRPPGAIYNDEVGENVTGASRHRILEVFGPPARLSQGGRCMVYRGVPHPREGWEFCFRPNGKMTGASGL